MTQQRVFYIAPEISPFLKLSSGADICSGLPKFVKEYGHEIRVIMPKHKRIDEHKFVLRDVIRLKEVPVSINGEERVATVKSSFIPDSKVQIYFVEIKGFYKESSFLDKTGKPRKGSLRELAFFSKAVLELLKKLCWYPNLIHTNDWQTGLIHYYLKYDFQDDENYKNIKAIHSVHQINQHGIFQEKDFKSIGLNPNEFDRLSLQNTAIESCQVLTLDNEESLMVYEEDSFYKPYQKRKKLEIIPHGYDDLIWNPQAKKMKQIYTIDTLDQKKINKRYLTHKKDLDLIDNAPVIVINIDSDFKYLSEIEEWIKRNEAKQAYFVLTSLDKDINRKYDDFDLQGDNYVYLRSTTNDDLKNYIAASEFYINLCNRASYNHRFAISAPFGTIIAGEKSKFVDQFTTRTEDPENFNAILVKNIKKDFDSLIDQIIETFHEVDMKTVQKRLISMLISWTPSGMRIGKIYDNLAD